MSNDLRLTYDMPSPIIIARNITKGEILLGRLGALGVGRMWFKELPEHKNYEGYNEAEIIK